MYLLSTFFTFSGQARKSLWIETANHSSVCFRLLGQARKSLWIETEALLLTW